MTALPWDNDETAECVNTRRPLTASLDRTEEGLAMQATQGNLLAYVLRRIRISENGCWQWTGNRRSVGYGRLVIDNREYQAHRVVYELLVGPIPAGLTLDHECHNRDPDCSSGPCAHRACVRPSHMTPKTIGDNALSSPHSPLAKYAERTHCQNGHPFDEENTKHRSEGGRRCRLCEREYQREWKRQTGARARQVKRERELEPWLDTLAAEIAANEARANT